MIGDDSIRSARPGSPASTGQVCRLRQAATAPFAHSGGSVIDRNEPALIPIRRWAATSDRGSAASRSASAESGVQMLEFSTTAVSRTTR